ncbi:hypothetical protein [Aliagarivorans marinus]|uniref:hypothetical protein n=1 Tax=Aliagarivorans marinus TaxID=561965 RepID=UPI000402EBDF|nr:hypothetical protein [Aliagarivorans marinus]
MKNEGVSLSDWQGQYIAGREASPIEGWKHACFGDISFSFHPDLPYIEVFKNGSLCGVVLGWLITPSGERIETVTIAHNEDIVNTIFTYGGRWVLVTEEHVYPDPTASQPIVYSCSSRVFASSTELIQAPYDDELVDSINVVRGDNWYPFGLTPKLGVKRLLPNHKLNLSDFSEERTTITNTPENIDDVVSNSISTVQSFAEFFKEQGLFVGLTAGIDSRVLLAGLRGKLSLNVEFWTAKSVALANIIDITTAKALAKRFNLTHKVVFPVHTEQRHIDNWLKRTGYVRAGAKMLNHRMEETAGGVKPFGHSVIGELARGDYWRKRDDLNTLITPELIIKRMNLPHSPRLQSEAQKWLDGLPQLTPFQLLDLLYLEQRIGCWASPANVASKRPAPTLFLLNRKDVIDGILGMSVEEKRSSALHFKIMKRAWPELMEIPINKPIGHLAYYWKGLLLFKKIQQKIRRVINNKAAGY